MGGTAVVHLALPEEVGQAIHVRDGMAMEDHAEEINGGLVPPAGYLLPAGPALTALQHIVDGRGGGVGAGLKADGPGAAHGHAFAHESDRAPGLLRGHQVEGAELVVGSPAPPIAECGKKMEDLFFRRYTLLHRVSSRWERTYPALARFASAGLSEMIELDHVVAGDLPPHTLGQRPQVFHKVLAGFRPDAVGVWVVGAPDDIVFTHQRDDRLDILVLLVGRIVPAAENSRWVSWRSRGRGRGPRTLYRGGRAHRESRSRQTRQGRT